MESTLSIVVNVVAAGAVLLAVCGVAVSLSAAIVVLRQGRELALGASSGTDDRNSAPPVSIILTVTEDDADIGERLDMLSKLDYPAFEIVVVSNGPVGAELARTMERLKARAVDLIYRPLVKTGKVTGCFHGASSPSLAVIEKERADLGDALNAGVNVARSPYLCFIAPGVWLDRAALLRLMTPVIDDPERVAVVTGIQRALNGCGIQDGDILPGACPVRPAVVWSVLEGLRGALISAGMSPLIGAGFVTRGCAVVHRHELLRAGGVPVGGAVEDLVMLAWTRSGLRSSFVPLPVCWSRIPTSLADLGRAHRVRARAFGEALGSVWSRERGAGEQSIGWKVGRVLRNLPALAAPLDVLALVLVSVGYGWDLVGFPLLLVTWVAVMAGRSVVSSAAILVHDITPKRYPFARDVLLLFVAVAWDLTVGRLMACWWAVSAADPGVAGRPPDLGAGHAGWRERPVHDSARERTADAVTKCLAARIRPPVAANALTPNSVAGPHVA